MVHCICTCDTQLWHMILYLWLYYRPVDRELSINFLVNPSHRQVGHHEIDYYISLHNTHMRFSTTNKAAYQQYKTSLLVPLGRKKLTTK